MADRNAGAAGAGTTMISVAPAALHDTQGGALLKAVQQAVAGEFEVFGELGRGAGGVIVYLARELASGHLVALRFTPGDHTTRGAGEMWVEVVRRLDETVPAANANCPQCGKALKGWGRYCSQCGADLSGVAADAAGGGTPEELLRAVKESARGRFEVLGEMSRTEGGGTVYFARDLRDGRITALRLQKEKGVAGRTEQYKLAQTQVLRSVADLLGGALEPGVPDVTPKIRLETRLQERVTLDPSTTPSVAQPDPLIRARWLDRRLAVAGGAVVLVGAAGLLVMRAHPAPPPTDPNASRADSIAALRAKAPPDSAEVQVGTALPAGATFTVDGQTASGPTVRLPAGAHTLSVTAPRRSPVTQHLTLTAGQVVVWTPTLAVLGRKTTTAPAARALTPHPHAPGAASVSPARGVSRPTAPSVPEAANTTASTCASLFATLEWARAFPACEREAGEGSTSAQRALATMYDRGLGADQDYGRAASWYTRAADAGDVVSQYRLALLLRDGRGVRRDERGSVTWLRRAADQGDANAQSALGAAYESGRGIARSDADALAWFTKAAAGGNVEARDELRRRAH